MKQINRLILIFLILGSALLLISNRVSAQGPGGDDSPVVFGDNFTLPAGRSIQDLVVFGGNATILQGSTVKGDILIFGGDLNITGTVAGDVTAFGGNITLGETADVVGTINAVGSNRNIAPGAKYGGLSSNPTQLPFHLPSLVLSPGLSVDLGPTFSIIGAVFISLMLALLAVIIALFLPNQTERVAQTIATEPVLSGGVGLLTLVAAPAIVLVLAITIILIPLALLFVLVAGITVMFGWIGLGLELGKRLAGMVHSYWPLPVSAGVGTLLLTLVSNLIFTLSSSWLIALCCIGFPVMIFMTMLGLGAVVSSRFGTQIPVWRPAPPVAVPPAAPTSASEPAVSEAQAAPPASAPSSLAEPPLPEPPAGPDEGSASGPPAGQ